MRTPPCAGFVALLCPGTTMLRTRGGMIEDVMTVCPLDELTMSYVGC